MTTYANQKVIEIEKEKYTKDFLQVGNAEWQNAYLTLKPATFALYLYLAGNSNGFKFALSAEAVKNAIGLSKATYHRAVDELTERKYLNLVHGNVYRFTTTPKETVSPMRQSSLTDEYSKSHTRDKVVSSMSTEIDKQININNIYITDEDDYVDASVYDPRLEGIWLSKEEAEYLEMGLLTVEGILE